MQTLRTMPGPGHWVNVGHVRQLRGGILWFISSECFAVSGPVRRNGPTVPD